VSSSCRCMNASALLDPPTGQVGCCSSGHTAPVKYIDMPEPCAKQELVLHLQKVCSGSCPDCTDCRLRVLALDGHFTSESARRQRNPIQTCRVFAVDQDSGSAGPVSCSYARRARGSARCRRMAGSPRLRPTSALQPQLVGRDPRRHAELPRESQTYGALAMGMPFRRALDGLTIAATQPLRVFSSDLMARLASRGVGGGLYSKVVRTFCSSLPVSWISRRMYRSCAAVARECGRSSDTGALDLGRDSPGAFWPRQVSPA
jgi:hypothetical protein